MMYSTAPLSSSRPRSNTTTSDAVSDITMMTTQQPSIVSCSSYSYSFSVPSPNYVKNNNNCEIINIINANNANNANNNNNNNMMSTTIISDNNNTRMSNSNSINSANTTNTITNSIHPEKNIMKRNRRDKTATNIAVGACIGTIILPIPVLGTIVGATVAGYTTNAILKKKEQHQQRKWERDSYQYYATNQSYVVNAVFV
jgi:hypothetical protein